MFSLFYGLWKYVFSKAQFHVLIVGIDKSGKTTLLEKLKSMYSDIEGLPHDRIVPTVGLNIGRVELPNAKLVFWDLGGQRDMEGKGMEGDITPCKDSDQQRKWRRGFISLPNPLFFIKECGGKQREIQEIPLFVFPLMKPYTNKLGLCSIWEKYYEEAHAVVFVIDVACPSRFEDAKSSPEKLVRNEDLQGAPILILANKQDLPEAVSAKELARYLDLKKLDEATSMFEAVSAYVGLGIRESVEWLVEVMERSKRTEMLSMMRPGEGGT